MADTASAGVSAGAGAGADAAGGVGAATTAVDSDVSPVRFPSLSEPTVSLASSLEPPAAFDALLALLDGDGVDAAPGLQVARCVSNAMVMAVKCGGKPPPSPAVCTVFEWAVHVLRGATDDATRVFGGKAAVNGMRLCTRWATTAWAPFGRAVPHTDGEAFAQWRAAVLPPLHRVTRCLPAMKPVLPVLSTAMQREVWRCALVALATTFTANTAATTCCLCWEAAAALVGDHVLPDATLAAATLVLGADLPPDVLARPPDAAPSWPMLCGACAAAAAPVDAAFAAWLTGVAAAPSRASAPLPPGVGQGFAHLAVWRSLLWADTREVGSTGAVHLFTALQTAVARTLPGRPVPAPPAARVLPLQLSLLADDGTVSDHAVCRVAWATHAHGDARPACWVQRLQVLHLHFVAAVSAAAPPPDVLRQRYGVGDPAVAVTAGAAVVIPAAPDRLYRHTAAGTLLADVVRRARDPATAETEGDDGAAAMAKATPADTVRLPSTGEVFEVLHLAPVGAVAGDATTSVAPPAAPGAPWRVVPIAPQAAGDARPTCQFLVEYDAASPTHIALNFLYRYPTPWHGYAGFHITCVGVLMAPATLHLDTGTAVQRNFVRDRLASFEDKPTLLPALHNFVTSVVG